MVAYHDEEWGVPVHDDRVLFEFLILEGAQAGLSWSTILNKRPAYRAAFDQFHPEKVARYGEVKIAALLENPGIVRNRLKVRAAVQNAQALLRVREQFGTFDSYIWQFVGRRAVQNRWRENGRPAGTYGAIGCDEQGSCQARFHVRWLNDLLCIHAGHRFSKRSSGDLLPV